MKKIQDKLSVEEKRTIIQRFISKMVEKVEDLDLEYGKLIDENFWDLV